MNSLGQLPKHEKLALQMHKVCLKWPGKNPNFLEIFKPVDFVGSKRMLHARRKISKIFGTIFYVPLKASGDFDTFLLRGELIWVYFKKWKYKTYDIDLIIRIVSFFYENALKLFSLTVIEIFQGSFCTMPSGAFR